MLWGVRELPPLQCGVELLVEAEFNVYKKHRLGSKEIVFLVIGWEDASEVCVPLLHSKDLTVL